jgi:quercetin dioxygenase-like cupin family protein
MDIVSHSACQTVEVVDGVHLTLLAEGDHMSIQHFHIEPGAEIPEHSHDYEQVGYVNSGTCTVLVDGTEHTVGAGDSYVVGPGETHGTVNDSAEPVDGIDVFTPPRESPGWDD